MRIVARAAAPERDEGLADDCDLVCPERDVERRCDGERRRDVDLDLGAPWELSRLPGPEEGTRCVVREGVPARGSSL
jgi:hypothetical protein